MKKTITVYITHGYNVLVGHELSYLRHELDVWRWTPRRLDAQLFDSVEEAHAAANACGGTIPRFVAIEELQITNGNGGHALVTFECRDPYVERKDG